MRMRILGPVLGLILIAALGFSFWPATEPEPMPLAPSLAPTTPVAAPAPTTPRPVEPKAAPAPSPTVATPSPAPAPSPLPIAPVVDRGELDDVPDDQHLRALGLTEDDVEPLDGGVLHKLDRDGIKGAIAEKLPEIRECYDSWLTQNPTLGGKLKVEFRILEIPGRDRGKVSDVTIADGGIGHIAMEGCVGNVFKGMRFEAPRGGEMRVTYPFVFSNTGQQQAPPP